MAQKTAALYARFSSDMQKDRSIDDQFTVCRTYALRENIKPIVTFADRAKSGASLFDRGDLIELMAAAKRREFDVVIVESLDRLSRDQEDLAGLFKRLNYYGVKILTVNEGLTTSIHVGIRGLVGSLFLADLGAKVKRGLDGRVRDGKFPGAVTYGYDRVLGKPGERTINLDQAKIVRRIFKEYADGVSPREIAIGLTRDNIPTPHGATHWNHQTFIGARLGAGHRRGLLGNRLYIGEIIWNARHTVRDPETGTTSKRQSADAERVIVSVPQLRIVDQKLWDEAHRVWQSKSEEKFGPGGCVKRRAVVPRGQHLLSGLLRCAVCSGQMTMSNKSKGIQYVSCAAAFSNSSCSHRKGYNIELLQKLILDGFRTHLTDPKPIAEMARSLHSEYAAEAKKNSGQKAAAEKKHNQLVVQIDRLVAAISDSDEPLPGLLASLKTKEAERVGLAERIRLLGADNVVALHPNVIEDYRVNVEKLHKALTKNAENPEIRTAFRNMLDSIMVHPTPRGAPYEISVYGRLTAILGVDLFPTRRSKLLNTKGFGNIDIGNPDTTGLPISMYGKGLISLGKWRA